jgi:hypothetical protein
MLGSIFRWLGWAENKVLPSRKWESGWTVTVTDGETIAATDPQGTVKSAHLYDLHAIRIRTTSDGPWFSDVWWWLADADDSPLLIFPNDAKGAETAVEILIRLDGFNHRAMIAAMGSTDDAWFPVWIRRKPLLRGPARCASRRQRHPAVRHR